VGLSLNVDRAGASAREDVVASAARNVKNVTLKQVVIA